MIEDCDISTADTQLTFYPSDGSLVLTTTTSTDFQEVGSTPFYRFEIKASVGWLSVTSTFDVSFKDSCKTLDKFVIADPLPFPV